MDLTTKLIPSMYYVTIDTVEMAYPVPKRLKQVQMVSARIRTDIKGYCGSHGVS